MAEAVAEVALGEYAAAAVCMILAALVLLLGSRQPPPSARTWRDGDKDGRKDEGRIERSQGGAKKADVPLVREHGRSLMPRPSASMPALSSSRSMRSSWRSGLAQEEEDVGAASFFEEMLKCLGFEDAGDHGFGFSVSSKSRPLPADFPLVEKIRSDLIASSSLANGDRILMVDSRNVAGMRAKEVKSLINQSDFRISLLVKGNEGGRGQVERQVVLYRGRVGVLRAFFTNYMLKHTSRFQSTPMGQEIAQVFRLFMTLSDQVASADELVSLLQHSISARPKGSIQKSILSLFKVLVVYQATECLHASSVDVSPMKESDRIFSSNFSTSNGDATDASPLRMSMLELQRSQVTDNLRKEMERLQEEAGAREAQLEATRKEVQRLAEELNKAKGLVAALQAEDQDGAHRQARQQEEERTRLRLDDLESAINEFATWSEDFRCRQFAMIQDLLVTRGQDRNAEEPSNPQDERDGVPSLATRSHEAELLDLCRRSLAEMCESMRGRREEGEEGDVLLEIGFLLQELQFTLEELQGSAWAAEDLRLFLGETLEALMTAHTKSLNFMSRSDFILSKLKFYRRRRSASLHRMQQTPAPGILHSRSISEIDRSPACLLEEIPSDERRSSTEFSQEGEDSLVEVLEKLLTSISSDNDAQSENGLPPPETSQASMFSSSQTSAGEGRGGNDTGGEDQIETLRRKVLAMEQMIHFRESSYNLLLHFFSRGVRSQSSD